MKKKVIILDIICAAVMLAPTCYAYIDPATTSYVIQIAAGVVIALGTAIGIYWNKLKRLFKKKKEDEPDAAAIQNDHSGEKDTVTADDLLNDD